MRLKASMPFYLTAPRRLLLVCCCFFAYSCVYVHNLPVVSSGQSTFLPVGRIILTAAESECQCSVKSLVSGSATSQWKLSGSRGWWPWADSQWICIAFSNLLGKIRIKLGVCTTSLHFISLPLSLPHEMPKGEKSIAVLPEDLLVKVFLLPFLLFSFFLLNIFLSNKRKCMSIYMYML